jgi:hypothetical protein
MQSIREEELRTSRRGLRTREELKTREALKTRKELKISAEELILRLKEEGENNNLIFMFHIFLVTTSNDIIL